MLHKQTYPIENAPKSEEASNIPLFPVFKKLELTDKDYIESFTSQYPPYSDFNFVSLWMWNTNRQTSISQLNGNLIIKLKNYTGENEIISFMGKHSISETMQTVTDYAYSHDNLQIALLPEINFQEYPSLIEKYHLELDRDQFDYIYNTEELAKLVGEKYHKKKNFYNRFVATYQYEVKLLALHSPLVQKQIADVVLAWKKNKSDNNKEYDENELMTVENLLSLNIFSDLLAIGVFVNDVLVGFTICEMLADGYAMFDIQKMNISFQGVSQFLVSVTAKALFERGYKYINFEQDMGIPGLRQSKESWHPASFLQKYAVKEI